MKINKYNVQDVLNYIKSLGFEMTYEGQPERVLRLKLCKFKRGDEEVHVWISCTKSLPNYEETSIESITTSHGVSLIKRGKLLLS